MEKSGGDGLSQVLGRSGSHLPLDRRGDVKKPDSISPEVLKLVGAGIADADWKGRLAQQRAKTVFGEGETGGVEEAVVVEVEAVEAAVEAVAARVRSWYESRSN